MPNEVFEFDWIRQCTSLVFTRGRSCRQASIEWHLWQFTRNDSSEENMDIMDVYIHKTWVTIKICSLSVSILWRIMKLSWICCAFTQHWYDLSKLWCALWRARSTSQYFKDRDGLHKQHLVSLEAHNDRISILRVRRQSMSPSFRILSSPKFAALNLPRSSEVKAISHGSSNTKYSFGSSSTLHMCWMQVVLNKNSTLFTLFPASHFTVCVYKA